MKRNFKALYLSVLFAAAAGGYFIKTSEAAARPDIGTAVCETLAESAASGGRARLIPCGTPFGIKMLTDGVVVTDFGYVNGGISQTSPAESAGVRAGDVITSVNGVRVLDSASLSAAVQKDPQSCTLCVTRDGEELEIKLSALRSDEDGLYKLGLWTRDSCAGIGTMTFYDPDSGVFGGLGHAVSDISTGLRLPLLEGEITAVSITDVLKGSSGSPGELCGAFVSDTGTGTVEVNSDCGIFGSTDIAPILGEPLETAFSSEVEKGKASILATVAGMMPQEYEIEIVKIERGFGSSSRNMTIRVTDSELLSRTGGIVQGMSGSPVIQNGRLVGAVTHVLVNDPSMGYAVFIENMCREAEKIIR